MESFVNAYMRPLPYTFSGDDHSQAYKNGKVALKLGTLLHVFGLGGDGSFTTGTIYINEISTC